MKKKDIERLGRLESENTKYCSKCKIVKPLFEFNIKSNGRKLAQSHCIECDNKKNKENGIFRDFGITLKDYDKMLEKQNGGCKICGTKEIGHKRQGRFCVDHNHKTGKIRGLLCTNCNRLLGAAKDDIEILTKAITYLTESKS